MSKLFLMLGFGAFCAGAASAEENQNAAIRRAVEKSLRLLQPSGVQFFKKAGCISCHHQSIPAMAVGAARERGITVDEQMAAHQVKATVALFSSHREMLLLANSGVPEPTTVSSYALLGLAAEKYPADRLTDAMVCDLALRQRADGAWPTGGTRPPISSTDIEATALTLRAVQLYRPEGRRAEFGDRIARARTWLLSAKAQTTEEKIFRLLGLGWSDADRNAIRNAVKDLLAIQRENGGWAGLPTLEPDAYATGLALVSLHEGGNLPVADAAYRRGVDYLLRTQLEDGSWRVKSRSLGFQPYFESGYPHAHDQWISAAGAGWSTLALTWALAPIQIASR